MIITGKRQLKWGERAKKKRCGELARSWARSGLHDVLYIIYAIHYAGGVTVPKTPRHSNDDTRAAWAKGYELSSQIITIALELVLPGLFGFLVDRWLGFFPVVTIVGLAFGFAAGTLHFVYFAKTLTGTPKEGDVYRREPPERPNG